MRAHLPGNAHTAHTEGVNSIDFNYTNENLLISGSSDNSVAIWDLRNLKIQVKDTRN